MISPEARDTVQAWTVYRAGRPRFVMRVCAPTMIHASVVELEAKNAYGDLASWRLGASEIGLARCDTEEVVRAQTSGGALPVFDFRVKQYASGPLQGQPYVAGAVGLLRDWLRRCREAGEDTRHDAAELTRRWAAPRVAMVVPKPGQKTRMG